MSTNSSVFRRPSSQRGRIRPQLQYHPGITSEPKTLSYALCGSGWQYRDFARGKSKHRRRPIDEYEDEDEEEDEGEEEEEEEEEEVSRRKPSKKKQQEQEPPLVKAEEKRRRAAKEEDEAEEELEEAEEEEGKAPKQKLIMDVEQRGVQKWVKEDEGPPIQDLNADEMIKRIESRIEKYGVFSSRWVHVLFTKVENVKQLKRAFEFYRIGELANKQRGGVFAGEIYKACARAKDHKRALDLFADMRNRVWPFASTLNSLMDHFGNKKDLKSLDTAWGVFKKRATEPNLESYDTYARGLAKCGEFDRARAVADECKQKMGKVVPGYYTGLAKAEWDKKNFEGVEQAAESAKAEGLPLTSELLQYLAAARLAKGDLASANAAFDAALSYDSGWQRVVNKYKKDAHLPAEWDDWTSNVVGLATSQQVPVQLATEFAEHVSKLRTERNVIAPDVQQKLKLLAKAQAATKGRGKSESSEAEGERAAA